MPRILAFLIALPLCAQMPRVGDINVYGARKLSPDKVRAALKVDSGEMLRTSRTTLEDRLNELPGVVQAQVQAICCDGDHAILFAGIEEKGAPHFAVRSAPAGNDVLPPAVLELHRKYLEAVEAAGLHGNQAEDLTEGHPLMADVTVRGIQMAFASYATEHLPLLKSVLRTGSEGEQRAIAATIIGYAPKKGDVIADLQYALQDPDDAVRANSTRALAAISVLATKRADLELKIPATWFIEMLNSIVLTDRVKATEALLTLTEQENAMALDALRERALTSLVEMARWKTLRYAVGPFMLLGRVAGLPEAEVRARWEKGEREFVITAATGRRRGSGR